MANVSQHAFSEKVAVVTGGDTAIGRAIAIQLGLYGAYVISTVGNDSPETGIKELEELGTLSSVTTFDSPFANSAESVADHVEGLFGRVDLIVNCSPADKGADFESLSAEGLREHLEETVESAFLLTKSLLRLTDDRPKVRIVNAFFGGNENDLAAICCSASMKALTKSMSESFGTKFQINGVEYFEKERDPDLDPDLFPHERFGNADDIARVVLYLLSGEAKALSGQVLNAS